MASEVVSALSGQRWPLAVTAALTFGAGSLAVIALTRLGGVFGGVLTGDLMLTGIATVHGDGPLLTHTLTAITGFASGVALGARVIGARSSDGRRWPAIVTVVLGIELAILIAVQVGWVATQSEPFGYSQLALLAMTATAMGLQNSALRGLRPTLPTTYLTGTLMGLVTALATGRRSTVDGLAAVALLFAVIGAASATATLDLLAAAAPLLALAPLAVVVGTASICGIFGSQEGRVNRPSATPTEPRPPTPARYTEGRGSFAGG